MGLTIVQTVTVFGPPIQNFHCLSVAYYLVIYDRSTRQAGFGEGLEGIVGLLAIS